MKDRGADHSDTLVYLKKIEGQIRGVQRMIEKNRYCVDILTQLHSITGAIYNVEDKILKKHFENCVVAACKSRSDVETGTKIKEILSLITKFRG